MLYVVPSTGRGIEGFLDTRVYMSLQSERACESFDRLHAQVISDLLKPERVNLVIREDRRRGVYVDGLSEWVVRSPAEVTSQLEPSLGGQRAMVEETV